MTTSRLRSIEHPSGDKTSAIDVAALERAVSQLPADYWNEGTGTVTLVFDIDRGTLNCLIIPNLELGRVMLKVLVRTANQVDTWLSLHDRQQLSEWVPAPDEWQASKGLFLPPSEAWNAVRSLLETGELGPQITWVTSDELPPDANW